MNKREKTHFVSSALSKLVKNLKLCIAIFDEIEEVLGYFWDALTLFGDVAVRVVMSQRAHNLLNCVNVKAPTLQ